LYKEFYSFKSHEAFKTVKQMGLLANRLQSVEKQAEALLFKVDVLICAGLFNEAIEAVSKVRTLPTIELKVYYYGLMTRLYGDLMAYNDMPHYNHNYQQLNHLYADSLLFLADKSSVDYQLGNALKLIDLGQAEKALSECREFIKRPEVSEHDRAMMYSCMAWGYQRLGDMERQIQYLLQSIESDIRSSTYETTSGRLLAQLLLAQGEIELAHQFLIRAIEDAEFYGARQRKAEITHIVPIVEIQLKEMQRLRWLAISSILILALISLVIIIYLWMRLVRKHREVKSGQDEIKRQNRLLERQNEQLTESNKIKEESLTNYFELSSVYFHEMDKMQAKVRSLLLQKKYDAIAVYLEKSSAQKDRERLYERFDALFIRLFPSFIKSMNTVLDSAVQLDETFSPACLSAEIRVFALLRLGIDSADRVASILGISRNTVYTYRNRIKTKVNMSPEEFEKYIMAIPAF
jgi:tetratricopeptide (TPR) repeat protein